MMTDLPTTQGTDQPASPAKKRPSARRKKTTPAPAAHTTVEATPSQAATPPAEQAPAPARSAPCAPERSETRADAGNTLGAAEAGEHIDADERPGRTALRNSHLREAAQAALQEAQSRLDAGHYEAALGAVDVAAAVLYALADLRR